MNLLGPIKMKNVDIVYGVFEEWREKDRRTSNTPCRIWFGIKVYFTDVLGFEKVFNMLKKKRLQRDVEIS